MMHFLGISALLAYVISVLLFLCILLRRKKRVLRWAIRTLKIGFTFHCLLLLFVITDGRSVVLQSRGDYFVWLAWVIPLSYFVMGIKVRFPIMGTFVGSAASFFLASSSVLYHLKSGPRSGTSDYFMVTIHALPALMAEASLVFAFIVSSVFLMQNSRLKRKMVDTFVIRGPNLDLLATLNRRFVLAGFVLMTVTILSGTVWAVSRGINIVFNDFSQCSALAAWILLALLVYLRVNLKWSEPRLSRMTVWLVGLFFTALLVVVFFGGNILHGSLYS